MGDLKPCVTYDEGNTSVGFFLHYLLPARQCIYHLDLSAFGASTVGFLLPFYFPNVGIYELYVMGPTTVIVCSDVV